MTILMTIHSDGITYWAGSEDVPGYTALADSDFELVELVHVAWELGLFNGNPEEDDLRWEWCGSPDIIVFTMKSAPRRFNCHCEDNWENPYGQVP